MAQSTMAQSMLDQSKELFLELTMEDVSEAADILFPVYVKSSGMDGFVISKVRVARAKSGTPAAGADWAFEDVFARQVRALGGRAHHHPHARPLDEVPHAEANGEGKENHEQAVIRIDKDAEIRRQHRAKRIRRRIRSRAASSRDWRSDRGSPLAILKVHWLTWPGGFLGRMFEPGLEHRSFHLPSQAPSMTLSVFFAMGRGVTCAEAAG